MVAEEALWEIPPELRIDCAAVRDGLVRFLREEIGRAGFHRAVVGLSGGIDSALSAFLAVEAFGADDVLLVRMPYETSSPESLGDAQAVIDTLGTPSETIAITEQIDAYFRQFPQADALRRGNKMARERMSILYDLSRVFDGLVVGTSNKSELLLGYGTQFGDLASAVNPIGDLYKSQVRQLARFCGVPRQILIKPPSADLWPGQSDEVELGSTYAEIDRLLYGLVDQRLDLEQLIGRGFSTEMVEQVLKRMRQNQYKRRMPVIAKVSTRTIGADFRYPRDW